MITKCCLSKFEDNNNNKTLICFCENEKSCHRSIVKDLVPNYYFLKQLWITPPNVTGEEFLYGDEHFLKRSWGLESFRSHDEMQIW